MGITKDYLRYEHSGSCGCVGSSNGAIAAVDASTCAVTACENVAFYNVRTSAKVYEISESTKTVTCIQFNKTKSFLAIGYSDGSIRLFDRSNTDSQCITFSGHKKGVNCLVFSNDGLTLASGGKDCTIILWDIVAECGLYRLNGHKESVTSLTFTLNDRFLVSSSKDTFVKFWCLYSQTCFYTLLDSHSEIYSAVLLSLDRLLVTASSELELMVFELHWLNSKSDENESGESITAKRPTEDRSAEGDMHNRYVRVILRGKLMRQCKGRALQLAVSPDQKLLTCLGADRLMDIYRIFGEDETQKRLTKKLKAAKRKASDDLSIKEEDIKKDVTIFISRIGDYRAPTKLKWIDFSPEIKTANAKSKCEEFVYSAFALVSNNTVNHLTITCDFGTNAISCESLNNLDRLGLRDDVRGLAVSSSNSALASGGGNEIVVWNTHSLRPVASLKDETMKDVTAVLFATGDNHIVAGTKNGGIHLWELGSCELLESRHAHECCIWSVIPLPDKKGFISSSADKSLKFWSYELVSEGTRKRLSLHERRILEVPDEALCCAVSPDSKFVAVGLLDNTASVYFMDKLKFFVSLYGHSLPVTCISISPDSKLVVTGSADKSIKIWGLDFGDCHKSFHAHEDVVSCVLFSPSDENLVWSAGRDGKIKQWDTVKLTRVQVLDRHCAEIRALAQTDTGSLVFSASHDKSIRCWELTEEIIVVEEEDQLERERHYEDKLADEEDVVIGENLDAEAGMATTKTMESIVSTENIIEAVDIVRNEKIQQKEDPKHKPHPLILANKSRSLNHFVVDTIAKLRPSNVERAFLMVPLSYISDILHSLSYCVSKHYKAEFCCRIAIFIIRIHHSHVINSLEMLAVVEKLKSEMPSGIGIIRDVTGFNLAALELLRLEIEEAQEVKLFGDISEIGKDKNKSKKKKERMAIVKTNV